MGIFLRRSLRLRRLLKTRTKGRACASLVILVSIVLGHLLFLVSWLSAFFITKLLSGRETGKRGILPSIRVPVGSHVIHLHHWFLSSAVMAFALVNGSFLLHGQIFYGLASGVAFQGIYAYKDWHKIVLRRVKREADAVVQTVANGLEQAGQVVAAPAESVASDEGGPL